MVGIAIYLTGKISKLCVCVYIYMIIGLMGLRETLHRNLTGNHDLLVRIARLSLLNMPYHPRSKNPEHR